MNCSVLSCLVSSRLVSSRLVSSRLVLSCLVLSCVTLVACFVFLCCAVSCVWRCLSLCVCCPSVVLSVCLLALGLCLVSRVPVYLCLSVVSVVCVVLLVFRVRSFPGVHRWFCVPFRVPCAFVLFVSVSCRLCVSLSVVVISRLSIGSCSVVPGFRVSLSRCGAVCRLSLCVYFVL